MAQSPTNIDLDRLRKQPLFQGSLSIGNDISIIDITLDARLQKELAYPRRFNGFLAVYCVQGHLQAEIDLKPYDITADTFFINVPGNILRFFAEEPDVPVRFVAVWMSPEFVQDSIRFDLVHFFEETATMMENPCIHLEEGERGIAAEYYRLARTLIQSGYPTRAGSLGALLASFFQLMASVWKRNLSERAQPSTSGSPRSRLVFNRFLRSVADNHMRQRSLKFYAAELCLTPKYLSKLIREVSGRSAPEWIDTFVILEAKNMLRYSDMSIKEVVYNLGFPNQSVFYKFFKARTGMTPSEFRRS